MTQSEILAQLTPIIREVLDNDSIELRRETTAADVEDWDSVAHVRIMVAVEEEFGVQFDTDELSDIPNVGVLVDLVQRKLQAN